MHELSHSVRGVLEHRFQTVVLSQRQLKRPVKQRNFTQHWFARHGYSPYIRAIGSQCSRAATCQNAGIGRASRCRNLDGALLPWLRVSIWSGRIERTAEVARRSNESGLGRSKSFLRSLGFLDHRNFA